MNNKFVVFLRAVNVSGKNIIKMAKLKTSLLAAGLEDVSTYIQSGNIVLQSNLDNVKLQEKVKGLIQKDFSLDVEVFVLSVAELQAALDQNPFPVNAEPNKVFITFLSESPDGQMLQDLQHVDHGVETFEVKGAVLYFYLPDGMAKSKMSNNYFEKKLKVTATGRNLNTVRKMLALTS